MKNKLVVSQCNSHLGGLNKKYTIVLNVLLVVGALFVTDLISAAQPARGRRGVISQPSTRRQNVAAGRAKQMATITGRSLVKEPLDSVEWKIKRDALHQAVKDKNLRQVSNLLTNLETYTLSDDQKQWKDMFEKKIFKGKNPLKKSLWPDASKKTTSHQKRRTEKGLWANLWDYQTSLGKYIPTTATGGAAAALASYFFAPAALSFLTLGFAVKLGFLAVGADRIYYSYQNGSLTESQVIDNLKKLYQTALQDGGRYPTVKSRIEALNWELEFPNLKKDPRIGDIVLGELKQEATNELAALQKNSDSFQEEEAINKIIKDLRQQFEFEQNSEKVTSYIENLESSQNVIATYMAKHNVTVIPVIRAICSEYLRMKGILAIHEGAQGVVDAQVGAGGAGEGGSSSLWDSVSSAYTVGKKGWDWWQKSGEDAALEALAE